MSGSLYFGGFKKVKKLNPKALERARQNKFQYNVSPLRKTFGELNAALLGYGIDKTTSANLITDVANMENLQYMNIKLLALVLKYMKTYDVENITNLDKRKLNSFTIDNIVDSIYERTDDETRINKRRADFFRYIFIVLNFKEEQLKNPTLRSTPEMDLLIQSAIVGKEKNFINEVDLTDREVLAAAEGEYERSEGQYELERNNEYGYGGGEYDEDFTETGFTGDYSEF